LIYSRAPARTPAPAQTEIGDPTKQVLQDTEQVQRFIVAQLQKIMQKKAVHPAYVPARRPPVGTRPPPSPR
jgi:hypothetical protein